MSLLRDGSGHVLGGHSSDGPPCIVVYEVYAPTKITYSMAMFHTQGFRPYSQYAPMVLVNVPSKVASPQSAICPNFERTPPLFRSPSILQRAGKPVFRKPKSSPGHPVLATLLTVAYRFNGPNDRDLREVTNGSVGGTGGRFIEPCGRGKRP